MYSIISALFRGAKRLFGPVWGIRIVNLVLFIYFSVATITDQGGKRVFAICGAIFVLIETALIEWERTHPRPKKRRWTVSGSSEVDQR
ncbi:hypothetical protein OOK58_22145 [Streptomyces sp. NBC_01728]|uniref:hypothetical protein n=1 Tax=unclassified Streptomyces TaxID=2593676 RepID=UPI00224D275B|nr:MULTISPECIES: hypothetical protein [unclassified Streptomyces]MCX4454745.1 hypothetical protein [Streptomyces sp. NBC_01719]MCX4494105.1 hypothetical protein [Streptomyces sp. NBC_01728]